MPYETVEEVQTKRIRVCSRCRTRMPEAGDKRQTMNTVGGVSGSLGASLGASMLVGSVLGPIGAIGGAIVGSIAGARAGRQASNKLADVVESHKDGDGDLCQSCRSLTAKTGTSNTSGSGTSGSGNVLGGGQRLGSGAPAPSKSTTLNSKHGIIGGKTNSLFLIVAMLGSATAFSLHQTNSAGISSRWTQERSVASRPHSFSRLAASNDDGLFDEAKVQEMDDMIISLSLEPTDESRRERLITIFTEELDKPNGAPQEFSDLFGHTLVIVGDRVRADAIAIAADLTAKAEKADAETETVATDGDNDTGDQVGEAPEPFVEQRQLWALVDMMIQSKTIVKRATGELGQI